MRLKCTYSFILVLLSATVGYAQATFPKDTMPKHKNIVRLSLTQPVLFGDRNLVIGYERLLRNQQSISVNFGLANLPEFVSADFDSSLSVTRESKSSGFNVSLDYRFYLRKENKHLHPRGVYIGPYVYIYNLDRENQWDFQDDGIVKGVTTDLNFRIFGGGLELGYQFLFWKRLALDLVLIGPGISRYSFSAKLDGDIDQEDLEEIRMKIKDKLEENFPGLDIVFKDRDFDPEGTVNTTTFGFRYLVHLGFYF